MRIGVDGTGLAPASRYTGMGEYAAQLLRALGRLEQPHQFIVYGAPGQPRPPELGTGMIWRPLPRLTGGKVATLPRHQVALPLLTLRDRLDLLHVPGVNIFLSHPPVPQALPCPLVVTLHDLIPLTYYRLRREDGRPWPAKMLLSYRANLAAARRAAAIITVSESARREILAGLRLSPERVITIYNGLDFDATPAPTDAALRERLGVHRPYLLFGGSFEPRKNLPRLLRAFDRASARGLTRDLVLIVDRGSGHTEPVRALAETLACRDRLRFLSGLPRPALEALYRGAEAFLFPSLAEGFGFPPLQAAACGVPVVAGDIPALREVLGNAALFVNPRDETALAHALAMIVHDTALRRRLSEEGPRRARKYDWMETARRTLSVYQTVGHGATAPDGEEG